MAVTLDSKWWKKTKPLTLLKEPLTKSFANLDKVQADLIKSPTRECLVAVSGAMKLLTGDIAATREKCNKTLHKDCIKALTEAEAKSKKATAAIQVVLKAFVADLAQFQKMRDITVQMLTELCQSKDTKKVAPVLKAISSFNKYLDEGIKMGKFSSHEIASGSRCLNQAQLLLGVLTKKAAEKPKDPKEIEKQKKDILGLFGEITAETKKIATLGGITESPRAAMKYTVEIK